MSVRGHLPPVATVILGSEVVACEGLLPPRSGHLDPKSISIPLPLTLAMSVRLNPYCDHLLSCEIIQFALLIVKLQRLEFQMNNKLSIHEATENQRPTITQE